MKVSGLATTFDVRNTANWTIDGIISENNKNSRRKNTHLHEGAYFEV